MRRRDFLHAVAGAAAGTLAFQGGVPAGGQAPQGVAARRQVSIGGRRVRVIDVHAHCVIPSRRHRQGHAARQQAAAAAAATSSARRACRRWTARAWTCRR